MPLSFLRGAEVMRWSAVDRALAIALTLYEERIDPSHGQRKDLALDPDLADEWTWLDPVRDYAALAMSLAAATKKDSDHPESWRYVLGLKEGWEERQAQKRRVRQEALLRDETTELPPPWGERAAPDQQGYDAEPD